uniref:AB hydrolase-1 domain-containing protein n=1 Tax=Mucochytrium quahogii TaxID=96639 RepID=A0A7S2SF24_9STRA|mmetsp:Transcript_2344/g.3382  ORF Transcript_2344/g.3382 Transcript_2344/m.3382 type:complete len:283 (-) Transcript_2344:1804-2652(-)
MEFKQAKLGDGRIVSYREYGDLKGKTVLFAHGQMNSAAYVPMLFGSDEATKRAGVRVIAVDRPGYGESEMHEAHSYVRWVKDMDEFTDVIGVDEFVVVGYSSGGAFALACGLSEDHVGPSIFKKVLGVKLISPCYKAKALAPALQKKMYGTTELPLTEDAAKALNIKDAEQMATMYASLPETMSDAFKADLERAKMQNLKGPISDSLLETSDWGFEHSSVVKPYAVWHGAKDEDAPTAIYFMYKKSLPSHPKADWRMIKDQGHGMIRFLWEDILHNTKTLFF